jgi:uncharacterized membrane protein YqiK
MDLIIGSVAILAVFFITLTAIAMRYRRCPSDKILVVYGKVSGGKSAHCHHGGAAFVWPVIQDYQYLDLTPLPIDIRLEGALSKQNIRVNTLAPGYIHTSQTAATAAIPEALKRNIENTPMKRYGRIDELKGAIVFLASDASSFVTGSTLLIDGGYTIW